MANIFLDEEMYLDILDACRNGISEGNERIYNNHNLLITLLLLSGTGLKVKDILKLTPGDISYNERIKKCNFIVYKNNKYYLDINTANNLNIFIKKNNIDVNSPIINCTVRALQIALKKIVDFLGCSGITLSSFSKFFARKLFEDSNFDFDFTHDILNRERNVKRFLNYVEYTDDEQVEILNKIKGV